ncbi:MAG: hypothetical protein U0736_19955 [Gemmataceae bacterium]
MQAVILLFLTLFVLVPALLLLVRRQRRAFYRDDLSPITRQHIDLFQGGQLSEVAVETAKAEFRDLLERGEVEAVENSLQGGMQYVVQVRALTELGTEEAGRILERQLHRRHSDDQIEQAWYWIDLANGLRTLNRGQSLPSLLTTVEQAREAPLGHFLAAETVCFLGFTGYLYQGDTALGRAARKVLLMALEGLRFGVPPIVVGEARLGELVETLYDATGEVVDPLTVRIFSEALRLLRRAPHLGAALTGDPADRETFNWQLSRLTALEASLMEYLANAAVPLTLQLVTTSPEAQRPCLEALIDLKVEGGEVVLKMLGQRGHPHLDLVLELLTHSRNPRVAPVLREWVLQAVPIQRRAMYRPRAHPPRRPSLPVEMPYRAILRALRGHPSPQTEALLLIAARDWDPTFRAAAVSSFGWWEPIQRNDVLLTLQMARRDANPEVRLAARAALARLGERQALLWFRQTLTSDDAHRVYETIHTIASEELTLLWPDLDRLADSESSDLAHHAREALERMGENLTCGRR